MEQMLRQLLQKSPYKMHMIVKDLSTDEIIISERYDDVFSSASLIKVPILLAVLHHVQTNKVALHQVLTISPKDWVDFSGISEQQLQAASIYELLVWMIITSDNTATNVLIDFMGMNVLNRYFREIGLTHTILQRKMMDFERLANGVDNVTTARDMTHIFTHMYHQDLLMPSYSALAIDILSRQRVHESLRRYLIDDVTIAHKTGGLETVDHDVGIVYSDAKDYLIGVFITEVTNNQDARQLIGRISKVVYEYLIQQKGALK
ncbi:serine hydrolase [Lysinibacillus parviboronicapiens]|uniref:serine hydrolase n=1 Tax=Lysinibacillus parviboronicapiens TaxID=436516 RepID=UPI0006D109FD|nr:serine hydrolase [Lysinibacillus parviboronicapiens]